TRIAVAVGVEVGGVAGFFHEVGDVEEGVALEADVHEGGLHAGKDAGDFAVIDGACESVFVLALVINLGEGVVFNDSETRLVRGTADVNFFRHFCSLSARPSGSERQTETEINHELTWLMARLGSPWSGQGAGCGSA